MKEIHVLMLGGKRCGKTTVLSSMCSAIDMALAGTGLSIAVDPSTQGELDKARRSIQMKMKEFEKPLTSCVVDENPTSGQRAYRFSLKRIVNGAAKGNGIPFCIHDIPGEWLTNEQAETVKNMIKDCQVVIIAIDTPYLMAKRTDQGYGQYHEEYNKSLEITNFFMNSLSPEDIQDRLILFVPIKCERYYHLDRCQLLKEYGRRYMQEMTQAISAGYRDLLLYLQGCDELVNRCTIAITPILSAGGIDFINFRLDEETGKMVSYYQAPEYVNEYERGYSPRFCEQPMVYILIYLLMQAAESMQKGTSMFQLSNSWSMGMNVQQMYAAIQTLRTKMKRNAGLVAEEDGYLFIQDPKNMSGRL